MCAHFDSVWRGPGVIDNATGVEGMFRVLERLRASGPHARSLLFCAFAAEEVGLLGSRRFVDEAKIRGELDDIVGVVCLDCIASGDTFEVMAGPEELRGRARAIIQRHGLGQRYTVHVTPPSRAPTTSRLPTWEFRRWQSPTTPIPSTTPRRNAPSWSTRPAWRARST